MPRNMSFTLTTDQIRNRTKTVTRRLGWKFLRKGDIVNACVKCQGIKKGEKIEKICQIRITDVGVEELHVLRHYPTYGQFEAFREGFPEMSGSEFVSMFCREMRCPEDTEVTRVQFEYLDAEESE